MFMYVTPRTSKYLRQRERMNPIGGFLGIIQDHKVDAELAGPSVPLGNNKAATKTRPEHSRYQGDRHNIWYNEGLGCVGTNSVKLPTKFAFVQYLQKTRPRTGHVILLMGSLILGRATDKEILKLEGGRTFVGLLPMNDGTRSNSS